MNPKQTGLVGSGSKYKQYSRCVHPEKYSRCVHQCKHRPFFCSLLQKEMKTRSLGETSVNLCPGTFEPGGPPCSQENVADKDKGLREDSVLGLGRHRGWWRRENHFIPQLVSALTGLTTDKIWFLLV